MQQRYNLRSRKVPNAPPPKRMPKSPARTSFKSEKATTVRPIQPPKVVPLPTPEKPSLCTNELRDGKWGVNQFQQRAQEDRYQVRYMPVINFRYFAVFDGHGGAFDMNNEHVGDYCCNNLHEFIYERLQAVDRSDSDKVIDAIKTAFVTMDTKMESMHLKFGSTCSMVLLDDQRHIIYQINLGDSRSVVFSDTAIVSETRDHKPEDEQEFARIEAAGSFVLEKRVARDLTVSRAFGDFGLKSNLTTNKNYDPLDGPVSAVPDVTVLPFRDHLSILLTSDAPFERNAFDNEKLVTLFRNSKAMNLNKVAQQMVKTIKNKTTDDTTILLVRI